MKTIITAISVLALTACGDASPFKGAGALYVQSKGVISCVEVDSVSFYTSRSTAYIVNNQKFEAQAANEFYAGGKCD